MTRCGQMQICLIIYIMIVYEILQYQNFLTNVPFFNIFFLNSFTKTHLFNNNNLPYAYRSLNR